MMHNTSKYIPTSSYKAFLLKRGCRTRVQPQNAFIGLSGIEGI